MTMQQILLSVGLPIGIPLFLLFLSITVGLLFNRRSDKNLRADIQKVEERLTAAIKETENRLSTQITNTTDDLRKRVGALERKTA